MTYPLRYRPGPSASGLLVVSLNFSEHLIVIIVIKSQSSGTALIDEQHLTEYRSCVCYLCMPGQNYNRRIGHANIPHLRFDRVPANA